MDDKLTVIKLEVTPDLPLFEDFEPSNTRPEAFVDHMLSVNKKSPVRNEIVIKIEEVKVLMNTRPDLSVKDQKVNISDIIIDSLPSDVEVKMRQESINLKDPLFSKYNNVKVPSIQTSPKPRTFKEHVWIKQEEIADHTANENYCVPTDTRPKDDKEKTYIIEDTLHSESPIASKKKTKKYTKSTHVKIQPMLDDSHIKKHEKVGPNNMQYKSINQFHTCKHCYKKYPHASSLRRHVLKFHMGLKPYACTQCNKRYSENGEYQKHLKSHTERGKYKCEICEKTFPLNSTFNRHMKIHSGEKRHSCKICDKRFFESCTLTRHMRTHTGEKPFICDQCNKGFVEKSALCLHLRIHTGEKPYECKMCHRRFNQISVMQRHVMTHTGQRPYECQWCGKRFIHSGNLSQHIVVHTGHQSHFACTQCDKTFFHRKSYQNHIMKVHSQ